jgi:hypothetical protein
LNRDVGDASGLVVHGEFLSEGAGAFHFGKSWYTPRLFSYEWQIKELAAGEGERDGAGQRRVSREGGEQMVGSNSCDRVARNVPNVNY